MRFLLIAIFQIVLFATVATAQNVSVVSVVDGDTLWAKEAGESFKIRLYGIDCPEKDQTAGLDAKSFVQTLMKSSANSVELQKKGFDRYGRSLAIVLMGDGSTLQEQLLKNGYAWLYDDFCKETICLEWKRLEYSARAEKRGLWSQSNAVPPWEWRKLHRSDSNFGR